MSYQRANMRRYTFFLSALIVSTVSASLATAWSGPTAAPPGNNVNAPINISGAEQFKPGVIGANILNIYGSAQYLNFGNSTGASGFGIRNNAGVLEVKHSGGAWAPLGANLWSINGTAINYSGGNVGIGTAVPLGKLHISNGTLLISNAGSSPASSGAQSGLSMGFDGSLEHGWIQAVRNNSSEIRALELQPLGGKIAVGLTNPSAKLYVAGGAYGAVGGANQSAYALGAQSIAADASIYSYGKICAGNSAGNCEGTGGVVVSGASIKFPDGTIQTTAGGTIRRSVALGLPTPPSGLSTWPETIRCHVPAHDNVHLQFLQGTNTAGTQVYYRGGANYDAYVVYNIADGAFVTGDNSTNCYYKTLQTLCGEGNCFY